MSINVDRVYQKVQAIANKEQRGYITPQEFQLLGDKATREIYEAYWHDRKTSARKNTTSPKEFDESDIIQTKLNRYVRIKRLEDIVGNQSTVKTIVGDGSSFSLPDNCYRLQSVTIDTHVAERVSYPELMMMQTSLLKPSATLGNYVYIETETGSSSNGFQHGTENPSDPENPFTPGAAVLKDFIIFPALRNLNTATDGEAAGGIGPTLGIPDNQLTQYSNGLITYYSTPGLIRWNYVVVNGKPLYNKNGSLDFDLDPSEEETLVNKILTLAGISMQRQDITSQANSLENARTAEKNN